jgi:drug/metabolite transporter (DMT)-like permease
MSVRSALPALAAALLFCAMLGPALLMLGLTQASGTVASLLLNVEGVLTALIAWWVFKENADRQIVLGMLAIVASLRVGFFGYGLSLTLFVVGLRLLGTARTGAYFSVAPLFGVLISLALRPSAPGPMFWLAAALMSLGVGLHLRERHLHLHTHPPLSHTQRHRHDAHHRHAHTFEWRGEEPHLHPHRHEVLTHKHPHYPDIHHGHSH